MDLFHSITCCFCGVIFGMTERRYEDLKKTKNVFYCVNGHRQYFTKSEADTLREELKKKEIANTQLQGSVDTLKRRLRNAEGTYQCPCAGCDSSYQQKAALRRHLSKVHGFVEAPLKALPAQAGPDAYG